MAFKYAASGERGSGRNLLESPNFLLMLLMVLTLSGFLPDTRRCLQILDQLVDQGSPPLAFPADCLHPKHFHAVVFRG